MTRKQFQQTLRSLIRRQPFQPFEVALTHGERFTVDRADACGFNGGAAAFIADDGSIHFFNNKTTQDMTAHSNGDSG
jgi:hypothetical protein